MGSHNAPYKMYQSPLMMADPGSGGSIVIDRFAAIVPMVSAGAEARTLAVPTKAGIFATLAADTIVGTITVTVTSGYNKDGDTSIAFDAAGDYVTLVSLKIGANFRWRLIAQEGTTAAVEEGTFDTITATTGNITEVVATNVNATTANLTECKPTNCNATNVTATVGALTEVRSTNVNTTGVTMTGALSANGFDLTANTISFFNANVTAQPSAIANANNNADNLAAQLNSVIAALETLGLIAS